MHQLKLLWITSLSLAGLIIACVGSVVPTQPADTISTIVAATMAAVTPPVSPSSPANSVPTLLLPANAPTGAPIPPTLPAVNPTLALPAATRIEFRPGATTAVARGSIGAEQAVNYVLQASQGQILMVNVDSRNLGVTVSIRTQGGTSMLGAAAMQSSWQQALPQTEDYYLTLHGSAAPEDYSLTVTIPSRIKFAEGADSIKVNGRTAGGLHVHYVLFAIKGQKMSVDLGLVSGVAALAIYGYTDGTSYVRSASEKTSFNFELPSTQDYIIEVVPTSASQVSYLLTIKIK